MAGQHRRVLKALADNCTKALFFPIGKHAGWHPEILKEVAAAGHTIGSHTWSHKDLSKMSDDEAKAEIEKGIAAVSIALGNKPVGPFFRFPALRHPPEMVKYVGTRNIGIFSTDMDSFDFKMRKPEQVIKSVMTKLDKHGKGIILMHDFQHATSEAVPELLKQLKAGGYKVVQVVGKTPVEPLPEYKETVLKEMGGGLDEARPMSSVIQTIQRQLTHRNCWPRKARAAALCALARLGRLRGRAHAGNGCARRHRSSACAEVEIHEIEPAISSTRVRCAPVRGNSWPRISRASCCIIAP